ncbi:MAG: hypothetical protein AUG45_13325 [Ktedonobacter sp. 13_1_20CM_3_54_15]|nr:MAG: hypothetical protein AUG45_13325 [Ktedonobacter sp. 13_1_20CM_3_54_15]
MTHPLFHKEIFLETAFEKRFQAMLRSAWNKRSWHVIVADPGSGKTMGIRDLVKTAGSRAILAIVTPKNNEDEQALGDQLYTALGLQLRGHWRTRKPKLMGHLHQYGTECIIVDDAHDLSLEHLMFIKEITDQGRLQYNHPLGLCLVAAGRGQMIPLKETLDLPDPTWLQFRRRLDPLQPFCRIAGHTSEEVRNILASLEIVYHELFPHLNLRQWSSFIYHWLTQSHFDPTHSGRVTMDHVMKLVTTALEWTYEAHETDVRAETLEQAAELLVLRRDTFRIIDGDGPSHDALPAESASGTLASETKKDQEELDQNERVGSPEVQKAVPQPIKPVKCRFSGVVPIDLQLFLDSGVLLVECPDCTSTSALSPHNGILRFKSHNRRKTRSLSTEPRWAKREMNWGVVGK